MNENGRKPAVIGFDTSNYRTSAAVVTLNGEILSFIKEHINRVSIGLQGTHEEELRILGRIHGYEDFLQSFEALRKAGKRLQTARKSDPAVTSS